MPTFVELEQARCPRGHSDTLGMGARESHYTLTGSLAEPWVTFLGRDEPAALPDPRLVRAARAQENRSSPAARSAGV